MKKGWFSTGWIVFLLASLAACGGGSDGKDGREGAPALVSTAIEAPGAQCSAGGWRIQSGVDSNRDGVLSGAEIQSVSYLCHGQDGADGQDGTVALTALSPVSAGAQCPAGGHRVDTGLDLNGNGQLESGEIQHTAYICHGVDGEDGQDGLSALVHAEVEPVGENCTAGGLRVQSGIDLNRNGELDAAEVARTSYLCHGVDGNHGTNAHQALLASTQVPAGAECPAGGYRLDSGLDLNGNGLLEENEITANSWVCHGADGVDGTHGQDGEDGFTSLIRTTEEAPGLNCAAGGVLLETGLDLDRNGELDSDEVDTSSFVCDGGGDPNAQFFTLRYTAQTGGSIAGKGTQIVPLGGSGEAVTAVPAEGHYFTVWSDGDTSASRTDGDVQEDLSLVAGFAAFQYTLSYGAGSHGSLSGISAQTVFHGSNGTPVLAVPEAGYRFVQWSDGSTLNPRTDLAVTANVTAIASFDVALYSVSYQATVGGSIIGNASQQVAHGGNATVVAAVPDEGYRFVQWSDGITTTNRTDTGIVADLAITAQFVELLTPPVNVGSSVADGNLVLNWDAVPQADSYNLYYAREPGVTPQNYNTLNGGQRLDNVSSPVTLGSLSDGERYYFVVTTVINGVESVAGETVSVLSPHAPWLQAVHRGHLEVDINTTRASINWPVVPGTSYNLYIATSPETDLAHYASHGAELRLNVIPPVQLENLTVDQPVYLALETNGVVENWTTFMPRTWGVNGEVKTQALGDDGTRYIGGSFTRAGQNTGGGAAFSLNGTPHVLGLPEVNGAVYAVISDGDGGWYIGGDFTHVGGEPRLRLAHINRSGRLTSWNPGADAAVHTLLLANNTIYAGGDFLAAGNGNAGIARSRLAAFNRDGSLTGWNPHANESVRALFEHDGKLLAGGAFTVVGGVSGVTRARLAAFELATGNLDDWAPTVMNNGTVLSLAASGSTVYAGGSFSVGVPMGGATHTRYGLAVLGQNGALVSSFYSASGDAWNTNQSVNAVLLEGDHLYVGGNTSVRRFSRTSGVSPQWTHNGNTNAVVLKNSKFYAAGDSSITVINPANGNTLEVRDLRLGSGLSVLAVEQDIGFVGGGFSVADGPVRNHLAALDTEGNLKDWNPGTDGVVNTLLFHDDDLYAGGGFTKAGDGIATTQRLGLAAFDDSGNLKSWSPSISGGAVNAMAFGEDTFYVGGTFVSAGHGGVTNTTKYRLAAFGADGLLKDWRGCVGGSSFGYPSYNYGCHQGSNQSIAVNSVRVIQGLIYVGGVFEYAGSGSATSSNRRNLAAFDTNGALAGTALDTYSVVNYLSEWASEGNTTLYVAGRGSPHLRAVSLANHGWLAWNPDVNGAAHSLSVDNDLAYIVGDFTAVGGGTERYRLAAVDALTGDVAPWAPAISGSPANILTNNGKVYVAGAISSAGELESSRVRSGIVAFGEDGGLLDQ